MPSHVTRPCFLFAVLMASVAPLGAMAHAEDVTLEGVSVTDHGTTVLYKKIDVTGTNLTKDEVAKLFSAATPPADQAAIIAKMKAAKVSIPDIQISGKGSQVTMAGFQITDIDAGRTGKIMWTSVDGTLTSEDGLPGTIHSNAMLMEGADFGGTLAAVKSRDIADMKMKITHVKWDGFDLTFADKDTPKTAIGGNIWHVKLASLEGAGTYDGEVPLKGDVTVSGVSVEAPKASPQGKSLALFGYDRLDFGIKLSGVYNPAAKTYVLDNYSITEAKSGTLAVKAKIGSLDKSAFTGTKETRPSVFMNADFSLLSLKFDNTGLFEKALAYFANEQKKPVDAVRKQWAMSATQFAPMLLGGDPSGLKIAEALAAFINNPKSLTLTATAKGDPVRFSELQGFQSAPMQILERVQFGAVNAP